MDGGHILMLAAENAALPQGKVGGIGDVVRDLPLALAELGCRVTVVTPEYGLFRSLPDATANGPLPVRFAGRDTEFEVLGLPSTDDRIEHVAFQHDRFAPRGAVIYNDDGPDRPFATDATKFAFFSACAASYLLAADRPPDVVHLHDWHAALLLLLRRSDPRFARLESLHCAFTIHNLALQGIRPLAGDDSSLASWFPELDYETATLVDPRYADCINPMAAAIRLADRVNTVSPTYAEEILEPNDGSRGFRGGEGLEADLAEVAKRGALSGILNGAPYPERGYSRPSWRRLLASIERALERSIAAGGAPREAHELALERLAGMPTRKPRHVLTSIGRITDQKVALFFQETTRRRPALAELLDALREDAVLIVLGSGDPELQSRLIELSRDHDNLLFVCGYFETIADALYRAGDLFLMPSTFEPCGISQMLAMRAGQPCAVHAVGGLKDTVIDGITGFAFGGESAALQADGFVATVRRALDVKRLEPARWRRIRRQAAAERFSWTTSARQYLEKVYVGG